MSYKIKNGVMFILFNGQWWRDDVLFVCHPQLKDNVKLTPIA